MCIIENYWPPSINRLCDRLKSQADLNGSQAVIEEGRWCVCHAGLHNAAASYMQIIILFLFPIITSICIDYRDQLVDLPDSLMFWCGTFWRPIRSYIVTNVPPSPTQILTIFNTTDVMLNTAY